jgi:hypothetical protein
MKKILTILTVLFAAVVATSCVELSGDSEPLALDNYDLTLPKTASKKGVNGENFHYFTIVSTGPWEATLAQQVDGAVWCWLEDHYSYALTDENGAQIKDEYGRIQTETVKVAEGVEFFPGGEEQGKYCRIRGGAGITYLPMQYNDNQSTLRYATFRVRRLDMDYEKFTNITQNK